MSMTAELQAAERRLAAMVNRRADAEEADRRADDAARVRADDILCKDLAAEYQSDYAAHGVIPPMARADEWSNDYERRLVRGLQRRLSPKSELADPTIIDGVRGRAFANFAQMIRDEAAREAHTPSAENLPATVDDPRAKYERADANSGVRTIEWRAKRSFIADMGREGRRVHRFCTNIGDVLCTGGAR